VEEVRLDEDFTIREVEAADLARLAEWIRRDPTLEFFERNDTVEGLARVLADKHDENGAICCIVDYRDRPLGYVEIYPSRLWFHVHGPAENERPWGMDVFIGDPRHRNRGLGARFVGLVSRHVLEALEATRVVIDPEASNVQAIRCYGKAGFRKSRFIEGSVSHGETFHDTWLMEFARSGGGND
jgi:aminoglycoside 6'-N-acetyltransferase